MEEREPMTVQGELLLKKELDSIIYLLFCMFTNLPGLKLCCLDNESLLVFFNNCSANTDSFGIS